MYANIKKLKFVKILFYRVLRNFEWVERKLNRFSVFNNPALAPDVVKSVEGTFEAPTQLTLQLYIVFRGQDPGQNFVHKRK